MLGCTNKGTVVIYTFPEAISKFRTAQQCKEWLRSNFSDCQIRKSCMWEERCLGTKNMRFVCKNNHIGKIRI
jgi:hypothetical protein